MTTDAQVKAIQLADLLFVKAQETHSPADWRAYHEAKNALSVAMRFEPVLHPAPEPGKWVA